MKNIFSGLTKTREQMAAAVAAGQWDYWRDCLIKADVGVKTTDDIVSEVRAATTDAPVAADFSRVISRRLRRVEAMLATDAVKPCVIIVMGVNGSGKTTTIAKLSRRFIIAGKKVLLAAGDTFRAAAREQLEQWAVKLGGLDIVTGSGDAAAVAYNGVTAARARGADIVLIDTAGRLPTQKNLMAELAKTRRAVGKAMPGAPHELLLVLDATTGQNALMQLRQFSEAIGVTGVVITKLDGSSKGGFLLALAALQPLPVRFAGVGESDDDLVLFDADDYAAALVGEAA